ncbi:16S rRNA (guanine(527)-N(7))-methyltransferase RsmG [uncultured Jatrophihabitans sp.]|uniref:16S rRNA (guanine(527)-N(7))-methyltransferase RsmG n=1 Tax=uncultured Jatrophihabitans sp. TaxID=1610747 RepID=UPI0035CB8064
MDPADHVVGSELPAATSAAQALFGDALELAERYARLLAGPGIEHGHLGPREVPRIWERHLANSAVVTDLVPAGATVVDVGSGAGLPGLPMAIRRADLQVVLVEPMLRRSMFLEQAVVGLELESRVQVLRGRAEDPATRLAIGDGAWVTARAVAPLPRLLGWCLPLLGPGGRLLALKGSRAADEVAQFHATAQPALRASVAEIEVVQLGQEYAMPATQVIRVQRSARRRRSQ